MKEKTQRVERKKKRFIRKKSESDVVNGRRKKNIKEGAKTGRGKWGKILQLLKVGLQARDRPCGDHSSAPTEENSWKKKETPVIKKSKGRVGKEREKIKSEAGARTVTYSQSPSVRVLPK